jgi:uncharacterized membrane protein
MSDKRHKALHRLTEDGKIDIDRFSDFISEHIDDDELLTQVLMQSENDDISLGERIADKVADFGGSWAFIITFFTILLGWIVLNAFILAQRPFDPYPFILLNLVLSCIAAIQAPVIMMSQNRKESKDRKRAQNDYLINLKAEMEIKNLQTNMQHLFDIQKKQTLMLDEILKHTKK